MLITPTSTTIQFSSPTDDIFKTEMTSSQSPSDGFVGLPPPPPPPPAPPVFNSNLNTNNSCKIILPHQEVNLVVNRANVTEIQARSIPTMLMAGNNIWTRRVLPNLRIKQTVFDQHYGETKSTMTGHYRRSSLTTSYIGGGGGGTQGGTNDDGPLSFVLLDATSKMLYDVPMRHLLQLVKKDHDDDASIDHVIRAIDEAQMNSEWLDAVTALNKQFDKRPEDKARVLAHKGSTNGLVLIEQFFVKLVRVPAYEFKLIYLKFREEAPNQLERMSKHIHDLLECIQVILNNEQLPGMLHLLCLLYNSITGKTIPGLHFDSLLSVLSTRTPKQNTTIAHVLCHLLEEQYPELLSIFDDQILLKLKDLSAIKYIPIYIDIRLLFTRYKQLNTNLRELQQQLIFLPEHIKNTLYDLQNIFTKLFDDENSIKKCEKDLTNYFCVWDLSIEHCFSTLGQFLDKLRLAHMQNVEQRRRNDLLLKQQQRSYENRLLQTPTTSRLLRSSQNQYGSDTNIFRDHLNVPLTPTTTRQRFKANKTSRERFYASSRDVSYTNDEQQHQQEQMDSLSPISTSNGIRTQNLLPNAVPRKRGHSPTAKITLTKRPFNALPDCSISSASNRDQQSDDVFISSNDEQDDENDTKMDCSSTEEIHSNDQSESNDDHLLPSNDLSSSSSTARVISVCEIQPSFYLTTPIRRLFDPTNDQSTPNESSIPSTTLSSSDYQSISAHTPSLNDFRHLDYSDNDEEHNKENSHFHQTSDQQQNTSESPSSVQHVDDDSQPTSSSSLPTNTSHDKNQTLPTVPFVLSDSETLDEGFETQSNVSETVEAMPRSSPMEIRSIDRLSSRVDETLAEQLTKRLSFNANRRSSHDGSIRTNTKRTSTVNARPIGTLKTSTSAYSYPSFTSIDQQIKPNHKFAKRTPSVESLRLPSTNNNNPVSNTRLNQRIQRCAVSRRISTEKESDETSKSLTNSPLSASIPTSVEPDEISSSSTVTTTAATVINTKSNSTSTVTNRRLPTNKSKTKIRNLNSLNDSPTSRSNSPNVRKISPRLTHANSCQNVSTITNNSPTPTKSSPTTKSRSPPSFFLNSSQLLRSTFTRTSEKPLRALPLSPNLTHETSSSSKTRRLFNSNHDLNSASIPSPKSSRKPPSSWHNPKSLTNKTSPLSTTVLHSSNLISNRKTSSSTNDLRKTTSFQRLTQSKRF